MAANDQHDGHFLAVVGFADTDETAEAMSRCRGWKPAAEPEPADLKSKRAVFKEALAAGVTIVNEVGLVLHLPAPFVPISCLSS
jgi:hypothetical protein